MILKRIHSKIAEDPTLPVRRVYDQAVLDERQRSREYIPSFANVRSRTKRFRSSFIPPIPANINDVDFSGVWKRTWSGKKFLRYKDNALGIALFVSKKMIKAFVDCQCLYVDGTFKTAPKPYQQLVTVHGLYNGFVVPLCFCLLTGKTTAHYRQLFQCLKQLVQNKTQQILIPVTVVIDFEASLKSAIEAEFPNCHISGCYFHFCSSLWRKVQNLRLTTAYLRSSSLKKKIRLIMAIAFLPPQLVRNNFNMLINSRSTARLVQRFPTFQLWLDYVKATYIQANALFATGMWNVFNRSVNTRTNNHLEGKYIDYLNLSVKRHEHLTTCNSVFSTHQTCS
jgi:hypothetical protein